MPPPRALTIALLFTACGGSSDVTVVEVPPPAAPLPTAQVTTAPAQTAAPAPTPRANVEWVGTYVCAQGETDLVLGMQADESGSVNAIFRFSSPDGTTGSYHMHGTMRDDGVVHLIAGSWIQRPPNYVTVGMTGRIQGNVFAGRIDNSSCGAFSLTKR